MLLRSEVKELGGMIPPPPAPYATQCLSPTQENLMGIWREERREGKVRAPGPKSMAAGEDCKEQDGEDERAAKRRK